MTNIIEVSNLSKSFGSNTIFEDITFQVKKGSFTALLGRNGSGKSTLLNILMGEVKLDKGDCTLFSESIQNGPHHLKNKIGHVSEKIRFNYPLTMDKFIAKYGLLYDQFDFDQFNLLAKDLNLSLAKYFGEYSRGQKMQMVLMAAICHHPELLLIDEITSVLDAYSRNYCISLLKAFTKNGGTVVLTTNIVNEIQYYCSDVLFLSDKKIKFQTSLEQIPTNFKKMRRAPQAANPFINSKDCIFAGMNSDGSESYIVPKTFVVEGALEDRRTVTLEDLYIYFSQGRGHE